MKPLLPGCLAFLLRPVQSTLLLAAGMLAASALASSLFAASPQIPKPVISPASGAYSSAQTVHYTTDGSVATASSPVYHGSFSVSASTVVKGVNGKVLAGTSTYTPPAGTVLATGKHTLTVTFTPADTTDYNKASVTLTVQ